MEICSFLEILILSAKCVIPLGLNLSNFHLGKNLTIDLEATLQLTTKCRHTNERTLLHLLQFGEIQWMVTLLYIFLLLFGVSQSSRNWQNCAPIFFNADVPFRMLTAMDTHICEFHWMSLWEWCQQRSNQHPPGIIYWKNSACQAACMDRESSKTFSHKVLE